jgi:glycosyltransferase involved in cell wall biosynthesis
MSKASKKDGTDIIFIAGSLPPMLCGVGFYSNIVLNKLLGLGLKVELIKTKGTKNYPKVTRSLALDNWKIKQVGKMYRFIKQGSANIVHIEYPAIGYKRELGINILPYLVRAFMPSKKIVVTLHEYHGSPLLGRARDVITSLPAHQIFISNQLDKDSLPSVLSKKADVVPIGSNIPVVKNNLKKFAGIVKSAGLDPKRKCLVFFGFPHPAKNLDEAIKAMAEVPKQQLLIIAELKKDNEYQNYLLDLINESPAKKRIGFAGRFLADPEVSIVLQNCRYCVLPQAVPITAKTGSGLAAVLHGNILITSGEARGSLPFKSGANCYFVKSPSANEIAKAINRLESDASLRKQIVAGAKELANRFDWDAIIEQHTKTYEALK